jgi:hypothetical protein
MENDNVAILVDFEKMPGEKSVALRPPPGKGCWRFYQQGEGDLIVIWLPAN